MARGPRLLHTLRGLPTASVWETLGLHRCSFVPGHRWVQAAMEADMIIGRKVPYPDLSSRSKNPLFDRLIGDCIKRE
jgi:hypothetical protein